MSATTRHWLRFLAASALIITYFVLSVLSVRGVVWAQIAFSALFALPIVAIFLRLLWRLMA